MSLGGDRKAAEVLIISKALRDNLLILAWFLACDELGFILVLLLAISLGKSYSQFR